SGALFLGFHGFNAEAYVSKDFAVQVESVVDVPNHTITLIWPQAGVSSSAYTIRKKAKTETQWNSITPAPTITTVGSNYQWSDTSGTVGQTYEYELTRAGVDPGDSSKKGYGYILAGLDVNNSSTMSNRG